jgi:hypothetical protein
MAVHGTAFNSGALPQTGKGMDPRAAKVVEGDVSCGRGCAESQVATAIKSLLFKRSTTWAMQSGAKAWR